MSRQSLLHDDRPTHRQTGCENTVGERNERQAVGEVEEDNGRDDGSAVNLRVRRRQRSRAEVQNAVGQGGSDGECVAVESAVRKGRACKFGEFAHQYGFVGVE